LFLTTNDSLVQILLIDLVKVLERPCRIGFDGGRLWFPVCGADFAMLLHELESFNEAKGFIDKPNPTGSLEYFDKVN
jgi:hypothetical protein